MELVNDVGHVESCFSLFGDRVNVNTVCTENTIGTKIVLDALDGTPR
jgi:hypothetical protein